MWVKPMPKAKKTSSLAWRGPSASKQKPQTLVSIHWIVQPHRSIPDAEEPFAGEMDHAETCRPSSEREGSSPYDLGAFPSRL